MENIFHKALIIISFIFLSLFILSLSNNVNAAKISSVSDIKVGDKIKLKSGYTWYVYKDTSFKKDGSTISGGTVFTIKQVVESGKYKISYSNKTKYIKIGSGSLQYFEKTSSGSGNSGSGSTKPTGITLNFNKITFYRGDQIRLEARITPNSASKSKVTWSSSNTKVASVDSNGLVTALGVGNCTITAKTNNGKKATCPVIVKEPSKEVKVKSLTMYPEKMSMYVGTIEDLSVKISPDNATNKNITWKSSDNSIAIVDSKGTVQALREGTVTITAKSNNGKKAKCKVTVEPKALPESLSICTTTKTVYLGETFNLNAKVSPSNAYDKKVLYRSNDVNILSIDSKGNVTAIGVGRGSVTAQTRNGKKATCMVTVKAKNVSPTSISLNTKSIELEKGKTKTVTATVNPNNSNNKNVTWTSSNTNIATVSNGKITAKAVGTATITAKTSNGKIASCKVTVKNSSNGNYVTTKNGYVMSKEVYSILGDISVNEYNKMLQVVYHEGGRETNKVMAEYLAATIINMKQYIYKNKTLDYALKNGCYRFSNDWNTKAPYSKYSNDKTTINAVNKALKGYDPTTGIKNGYGGYGATQWYSERKVGSVEGKTSNRYRNGKLELCVETTDKYNCGRIQYFWSE